MVKMILLLAPIQPMLAPHPQLAMMQQVLLPQAQPVQPLAEELQVQQSVVALQEIPKQAGS